MITPKVHVHTSSPDAFYVNSFIIEGQRSVILVDTQFVLSEATVLLHKIDVLQKPLAAIFITHPHPDHYSGLATVLAKYPGTRVHATAATIAGIGETAEPKRAYWTPIVGADYPQTFALPDVTIFDGQHLIIDGIDLKISDLGPTECSDNTIIELPQANTAIISDLVYNQVHPWLAEGRSTLWLKALETVKTRLAGASMLYAGHGPAGSASIIDEQASYILNLRDLVENLVRAEGGVSESRKGTLVEKISSMYPNWPLGMIVGMSIDGVAGELSAR